MSEKKQFLSVLLGIVLFSIISLLILTYYKYRKLDNLKQNGIRDIVYYDYDASRPGTEIYYYSLHVDGKRYGVSTGKMHTIRRNSPFPKNPVMAAYEKGNPDNNMLLPDEPFDLNGYHVKWIYNKKKDRYEMEYKKVND